MAKETTETKDTGVAVNDAYTGMLVVSLLALITGSVLLYIDYSQYQTGPPSAKGLPAPAAMQKGPEVKQPDGGAVPPVPENKDGKDAKGDKGDKDMK